jgi:hypothetical protein
MAGILTRIEIGNERFDFERPPNMIEQIENRVAAESTAASGRVSTSVFHNRATLRINWNIASPQIEAQLRAIWDLIKSGTIFSMWVDYNAPAMVNFHGGLLLTNNNHALTFTRASVGNVIASNGKLINLANDVAKIIPGKFKSGITIERTKTNHLLHSSAQDNAAWTKTNITVVANTAEQTDPRGTFTAERLQCTVAFGTSVQNTAAAFSTNSWIFSIFLKAGEGYENQLVNLYVTSSTAGNQTLQQALLTNEWKRYDCVHFSVGSVAGNAGVKIEMPTTGFIYTMGAQMEASGSVFASTTLIETTTATATKAEDLLNIDADNIMLGHHMRNGTFCFWFRRGHDTVLDTTDTQYLFYIANSVSTTRWINARFDATNLLIFEVMGINEVSRSVTLTDVHNIIVPNQWHHFAFTWKIDNPSRLEIFIDGVSRASSTAGGFVSKDPLVATLFNFGGNGSSAGSANGDYSEFQFYNRILSTLEILALFTATSSSPNQRNFFPSVQVDSDRYAPRLLKGNARFDIPLFLRESL